MKQIARVTQLHPSRPAQVGRSSSGLSLPWRPSITVLFGVLAAQPGIALKDFVIDAKGEPNVVKAQT